MPYVGWSTFSERLLHLLQAVKTAGLVTRFNRVGYRTINFFPGLDVFDKLTLKIEDPIQIETESYRYSRVFKEGILKSQIAILNDAAYSMNKDAKGTAGSVIDIDSSWDLGGADIDVLSIASQCHDLGKTIFFDFLSEDFLNDLGAEYE